MKFRKSLPIMKPENTVNLENPKPVKIGTKKIYKKKVPKIYFGTRTHKQVRSTLQKTIFIKFAHNSLRID